MLLRDRLRAGTRAEHVALEAYLQWERRDVGWHDYAAYLRGWLGFYRSIAEDFTAGRQLWPGVADCDARIAWLENDLAFLQAGAGARPAHAFFKPLPAVPELAGATYVVEGAALGGHVLYRQLEQRWGIEPHKGGSFLYAFGPAGGLHWRQFVQALNALTLDTAAQVRCVAAARQTFRALQAWFAHERCACPGDTLSSQARDQRP